MAILQPEEYDISYFDGRKATYSHNAGYGAYERWYRKEGVNSLGEFWKDEAKKYLDTYQLQGKKVLELGCAKGFIVKDLRDMGVDAYGLDISQYAIDNCEPEAAPYLTVGDARTTLSTYKNREFDVVFSRSFMECIPEADLPSLIDDINRISKSQFHIIDEFIGEKSNAAQYYLNKPIEDWVNYSWPRGTKLVKQENNSVILTK